MQTNSNQETAQVVTATQAARQGTRTRPSTHIVPCEGIAINSNFAAALARCYRFILSDEWGKADQPIEGIQANGL